MRSLLCAAAALAVLGVSQTATPAAIPSYDQAAVA